MRTYDPLMDEDEQIRRAFHAIVDKHCTPIHKADGIVTGNILTESAVAAIYKLIKSEKADAKHFALCWQGGRYGDGSLASCDRAVNHKGPHSWENAIPLKNLPTRKAVPNVYPSMTDLDDLAINTERTMEES